MIRAVVKLRTIFPNCGSVSTVLSSARLPLGVASQNFTPKTTPPITAGNVHQYDRIMSLMHISIFVVGGSGVSSVLNNSVNRGSTNVSSSTSTNTETTINRAG